MTEEMVVDTISCGPDPDRHARAISEFFDAGFDEVYVNQIGSNWSGFLEFYNKELQPRIDS